VLPRRRRSPGRSLPHQPPTARRAGPFHPTSLKKSVLLNHSCLHVPVTPLEGDQPARLRVAGAAGTPPAPWTTETQARQRATAASSAKQLTPARKGHRWVIKTPTQQTGILQVNTSPVHCGEHTSPYKLLPSPPASMGGLLSLKQGHVPSPMV